jgi:hypothetical protein
MDPQIKLAFEFASDLTKQLITLSTGIIVITIAFTKDILSRISKSQRWLLGSAWVLYLISVICGIFSLMALTGALAPLELVSQEVLKQIPSIPRQFARWQIITFLVATVIVILYGVLGLRADEKESPNTRLD